MCIDMDINVTLIRHLEVSQLSRTVMILVAKSNQGR